jgi:large subunit ribosomal protein L30
MAKKLELKLVRSVAGTPEWMRVIVRTLALRRLHKVKIVGDTGAIRGMVAKVPHLVSMKEVEG